MSAARPVRLTKRGSGRWRAKPTIVDGIRFDSKAEAGRYGALCAARLAGEIHSLKVHPAFEIVINGQTVCTYVADFAYVTFALGLVVEDVKSPMSRTPLYRLKKKLMRAVHDISITEIEAR